MQLAFASELTPGAGAAKAMLGWRLLDVPGLLQPAEKKLGQRSTESRSFQTASSLSTFPVLA